jgi:nucleoside-diphosphate-sugar epimerase
MKYLVTGATGFIGGRLVRQLRQEGHQVTALVRDPAQAAALADLGVTLARGDVTDRESMRTPMQGVDGLFHLAGWYRIGARDKTEGRRVNVLGTRNALELMQELGIPKGVYTSTLAVNSDTRGRLADEGYRHSGRYLSEYERSKAEAHRIAEQFIARGLPLVIVMPGLVYGPGDTSIVHSTLVSYLQRRLPVIPRRTAYGWAHVEDVAQAHRLAMEKGRPGEAYIVCGPTHTLIEALRLAHTLAGIPLPRIAPPLLLKAMSVFMAVLERLLPLPALYTAEGLRVIAGTTYIGDDAKARRELGYSPRPLEIGLREAVEHEMRLLGMKE